MYLADVLLIVNSRKPIDYEPELLDVRRLHVRHEWLKSSVDDVDHTVMEAPQEIPLC